MNYDDMEYWNNHQKVNERKERQIQSKGEFARQKVSKTVKTSIMTSVIGALSDFEEFMGELWGHGKPYNQLTEEQKKNRELWLDARDSILRRGSNSVKLSLRDINRCTFSNYQQKKYDIIIKPREDDENG